MGKNIIDSIENLGLCTIPKVVRLLELFLMRSILQILWPLGMLLAEILQIFLILYQNSPAKDDDSEVKSEMLDFWTFLD